VSNQAQCSRVAARVGDLDAGDGAAREERVDRGPVVRRAIGDLEHHLLDGHLARRVAAQLAGRHAIARAEKVVEAAQAGEPARHRDVDHRHRAVREQPLGEEQALRLRVLDRRDAELLLEDSAQMAIGHPQRARELLEVRLREAPVLDHSRRGLGEAPVRIHRGVAGRELRAAAQARAKAAGFRRGRAREEAAVAPERRAHRAHGAAIDPRAGHAHEEAPVEARIVGLHGAITLVGIE
jgi:hypothetical protein